MGGKGFNEPIKICGREFLKNLKRYRLLKAAFCKFGLIHSRMFFYNQHYCVKPLFEDKRASRFINLGDMMSKNVFGSVSTQFFLCCLSLMSFKEWIFRSFKRVFIQSQIYSHPDVFTHSFILVK